MEQRRNTTALGVLAPPPSTVAEPTEMLTNELMHAGIRTPSFVARNEWTGRVGLNAPPAHNSRTIQSFDGLGWCFPPRFVSTTSELAASCVHVRLHDIVLLSL